MNNDVLICNDTIIEDGIFKGLKIKKVILNDTLEIKTCAFYNCELEEVILPNTLKIIKMYAFYGNKIKKIIIPSSVDVIEDYAFDKDTEIIYKGLVFNKEILSNYSNSNIISISKILDIIHNIDISNFSLFFPKKIVDVIPINNDSIKSYIVYRKKFFDSLDKIYEKEDIDKYLSSLYKLYYMFGFFSTNMQDDVAKVIKKFSKLYNLYDINEMFKNIELDNMYPKLSKLILDNYSNPAIPQILIKYYNMFKELMKLINKKKKEILRKKSVEIIKEKVKKSDISSLEKEYKEQLKDLKRITLSDIIEYVNETNFNIKNKELYDVALTLSSYISSKDFDGIEELYEESKMIVDEKYFKNLSEERSSYNKKYYAFLKNSDPINLILGYLCDCCAKYNNVGEDVIRQSMTNPCVKTLVIYNGIRKIVAKSTCFYNLSNHTIVFNAIEASKSFVFNSSNDDKKEVILAFLRGIKEQIKAMNECNLDVREVRMEIGYSRLKESLLDMGFPITFNRLPNYKYKDLDEESIYQVVLYKKR